MLNLRSYTTQLGCNLSIVTIPHQTPKKMSDESCFVSQLAVISKHHLAPLRGLKASNTNYKLNYILNTSPCCYNSQHNAG
ncbi:unnamed protein product [Gadus morhua 'NCC']